MPSTYPVAAQPPSVTCGLHIDRDGDVSLPYRRLRLRGELDLATASVLAASVDEQAPGCERLELDLSGLVFCDLVGLTALEQAQRRLRSRGCHMSVHGLDGQPRRLLEVDGLRSTLVVSSADSPAPAFPARPRRTLASLVAGLVRR